MKKIISKEELIGNYYLLRTDPTGPQGKIFDDKDEMLRWGASHSITLQGGMNMFHRSQTSDKSSYLGEFRFGGGETFQEIINRACVCGDDTDPDSRTISMGFNDGHEVEVSEAFALEFLSLKQKGISNNS